MAWFLNKYRCGACGRAWADEWSCTCDDDCPHCGDRSWSPYDSDDLSTVVVAVSPGFAVLQSADEAEDDPDYRTVFVWPTRQQAEAFRLHLESTDAAERARL